MQTIGARFAHGELTLERAAELGCRACGSPGGGCQFLGTAATAQVVGEALGLSLPHSALAPSGQPIWLDMARRSARALVSLEARGLATRDVADRRGGPQRDDGARRLRRLDQPPAAPDRGRARGGPAAPGGGRLDRRSTAASRAWSTCCRTGPRNHPTVRVFLAGGVPEVMLHLRRGGLLDERCLTVSGETAGARARLVGGLRAAPRDARAAARAGRRRSGRRHHGPGAGAGPRPHEHGHLSRRQPGAGGRGDQDHRDRPVGGGRRRRLPQGAGPPACSPTERAAIAAIKSTGPSGSSRAT